MSLRPEILGFASPLNSLFQDSCCVGNPPGSFTRLIGIIVKFDTVHKSRCGLAKPEVAEIDRPAPSILFGSGKTESLCGICPFTPEHLLTTLDPHETCRLKESLLVATIKILFRQPTNLGTFKSECVP